MIRSSDWDQRLADYLVAKVSEPYAYGTNDCALFAAGAVLAMTDDDPAAAFRGKYHTRVGSVRALKRYGAGTLEATIDALFPERPIGFARRGDLVMHEGAVGVCVGDFAVFVGQEGEKAGLVRVERRAWSRAWGVGA